MNRVAVIIVTYNRLSLLKEEISSLMRQTYRNFSVIVVNNGSTDNTIRWLEAQKNITTITQDNQGCSGGMFTGIKYAVEKGYELCWVMDDDVEYKEDSLAELIRSYDLLNGKVGYLCSKVEGIEGKPMNVPMVDMRNTENGYPCYYDMISEQMIKVEKATFVSLLFSSSVVRKVGLPLKEFFIWSDDYEYTKRISNIYPSYLCCKSVVIHKRSIQGDLSFDTESNTTRLKNYFYFFRNNAYMVRKYQGGRAFYKHLTKLILKMLGYLINMEYVKSTIIFKSLCALFSFNPKVEYPDYKYIELE